MDNKEHISTLEILNYEPKFVWIINEFRKLSALKPEQFITSPDFILRTNDNEWDMSVELDPNGYVDGTKRYASLCFTINRHDNDDDSKTIDNAMLVIDYMVYLIDTRGHEYHNLKGITSFDGDNTHKFNFIETSILEKFLESDKLTIHINIRLVNGMSNLYIGRAEKSIDLLKNFEQLFENNLFNDVTIVAADVNFSVQRSVLACRSPVFSAMFTHDMKEKRESKVIIDDISPEVVKEMLRFIYCGKVQNLHILAADLLAAADKYQVNDLKDLCEGEMYKNMSKDCAVDILVVADRYKLGLKEYTLSFINNHLKEIVSTPGFEILSNSGNSRLIGEILKHISTEIKHLNATHRYRNETLEWKSESESSEGW